MNWFVLLPLAIGVITVLQGGLNRQLGGAMGLGSAVLLNAAVVMGLAIGLYAWVRAAPASAPALFRGELGRIEPWMLLPGLFGFSIIAGIPWAISALGASRVFVGIVVAQLVTSMVWDVWVEGRPVTTLRALGVALGVVSVILVTAGSK
jgi:transporter family-2 protein